MSFEVIASLVLAAVVASFLLRRTKAPGAPLPPGPKGYPLIGNLLDVPSDGLDWVTYRNWGRQYGSDVIHMNVVGQSIVILNSWDAVNDLIEKRSNLYSSRPIRTMVNDLLGWSNQFPFMSYGERWRRSRKMFSQEFTPTAVLRYHPQEIASVNTLLNRLLDTPDDWFQHLRIQAGQVIMSVAYGIDVKEGKDMWLDVIETALHGLNTAARPGAYMCDVLPFLKHVPSWLPGAGFKRQAAVWRQAVEDMVELPYQKALDLIGSGAAIPSYTSYLLEGLDPKEDNTEKETMIKETAGSIYSAGADTTVAVIVSFMLAMIWYPEIQKKAQQELDAVLGKDQLPDFADEASLPYCGAIIKELYRWRPVTPFAIPRETDTEDVYKGMRIPASTVILPNSWAILHNEQVYPEPDVFKPERYLKDGVLNLEMTDPTLIGAFGYGRRICPGRFLAQKSVWISVTSILASMNITRAIDERGAIIEPTGDIRGAMVNATLPFQCSIKPRSAEVATAIRAKA